MSGPAVPQPSVVPPAPAAGARALEEEALGHAAGMYRLAARLAGSTDEARDLLQEAFAQSIAQLRRGTFRGDCALSTWLYRIVTNVALNRQRSRKRRNATEQQLPSTGIQAPASEAVVALRELGEAMSELPDDQRAALVLKEIQGLSLHEVAQVLERTEGAVEQLIVRARQALRRRFEP